MSCRARSSRADSDPPIHDSKQRDMLKSSFLRSREVVVGISQSIRVVREVRYGDGDGGAALTTGQWSQDNAGGLT